MYIVDIKLQHPDGEIVRVRKVSPVANLRGARAYERELREALMERREPPGEAAAVLINPPTQEVHHERPQPSPTAATRGPSAPRMNPKGAVLREPTRSSPPTPAGPRAPTFAEFLPEFMRYQASPAASRRGANKPGELREKQRVFDNHLLPAFGSLRLDQISPRMIDRYIAAKSSSATAKPSTRRARYGEPLAPATVSNHIILLRRVLSVAHRWELIDRVPAIHCPAPGAARTDFLTFAEADRFLGAAEADWRPLLLLAIRTGLRLGEIRALRWRDLHIDPGYLRVERNLTKSGYGQPKSGKARTVEMSIDLRDAMRAHPRARSPEDLVFCQADGRPWSEGQVYRAVKATAKRAGLRRDVHPHMLRHTFASHCVMRGIPLAVVREWLGHAESRMTERYAHLAPEVRSSFVDRLAGPPIGEPTTGSRGNGQGDQPESRGNIGATARPQNGRWHSNAA
jgi:integrase